MEIYVQKDEAQQGPYTLDEIRARIENGALLPDDWGWNAELSDWARLRTFIRPPEIKAQGSSVHNRDLSGSHYRKQKFARRKQDNSVRNRDTGHAQFISFPHSGSCATDPDMVSKKRVFVPFPFEQTMMPFLYIILCLVVSYLAVQFQIFSYNNHMSFSVRGPWLETLDNLYDVLNYLSLGVLVLSFFGIWASLVLSLESLESVNNIFVRRLSGSFLTILAIAGCYFAIFFQNGAFLSREDDTYRPRNTKMETEIKAGLSEMGYKNLSPQEELELREIARQAGSTKP